MVISERSLENNSSGLDTVFRSLRSGRHGHRLNLWANDIQHNGGSNNGVRSQGLEELLISQLRRPTPEKLSELDANAEPDNRDGNGQIQTSEPSGRSETIVENSGQHGNDNLPPPVAINSSDGTNSRPAASESLQGTQVIQQSQPVEMQFEHNDAAVRDVEAVSQESGGSGATFGESLRSLDVEIGSYDGHDDGGDRQGSADRMSLGDSQAARMRRSNVSFTNSASLSGRDTSLHIVTEVSENSSREADEEGPVGEQQTNSDTGSGAIDPAFLDALPEELRAEVLSTQQGQVVQPPSNEPQNSGDIDPEFLAALPPDIRAEVLAQQQAQRLHLSQELEGQPVEMDTVSIIATFPSDLREEVICYFVGRWYLFVS